MPVVATRITVPSKPSSPTRRFEPPPSASHGSPRVHASAARSTRSRCVVAVTSLSAGPPTCSVVSSEKGMSRAMESGMSRAMSAK